MFEILMSSIKMRTFNFLNIMTNEFIRSNQIRRYYEEHCINFKDFLINLIFLLTFLEKYKKYSQNILI